MRLYFWNRFDWHWRCLPKCVSWVWCYWQRCWPIERIKEVLVARTFYVFSNEEDFKAVHDLMEWRDQRGSKSSTELKLFIRSIRYQRHFNLEMFPSESSCTCKDVELLTKKKMFYFFCSFIAKVFIGNCWRKIDIVGCVEHGALRMLRCSRRVPSCRREKLDLAAGVANTTPDDATPALCPDANFTIAHCRDEPVESRRRRPTNGEHV